MQCVDCWIAESCSWLRLLYEQRLCARCVTVTLNRREGWAISSNRRTNTFNIDAEANNRRIDEYRTFSLAEHFACRVATTFFRLSKIMWILQNPLKSGKIIFERFREEGYEV